MALALESLVFDVNTEKLLAAKKAIDDLGVSVTKLDKITKEEAESAVNAAKVRKANADAATKEQKEIEATTKAKLAEERANRSLGSSSNELEKLMRNLTNTYADMAQGSTKGESSILNRARNLGATTQQIAEINQTLEKIGSLNKNPFDASLGAIRSITQELDMLRHRANLAGEGIVLSAKHMQEFGRISAEASAKLESMGVDINSKEGLERLNDEIERSQKEYLGYVKQAESYLGVEKDRERVTRLQTNAMRTLSDMEEKAASMVAVYTGAIQTGDAVTERSAASVAAYSLKLQQAGIFGAEAANKLKVFSAQQTIIASQEQKQREAYLTRAIIPQFSDIFVGLTTGQNPLTIMMQQLPQIQDLFTLTGVKAQDTVKVIGSAASEMFLRLKDTGIAVTQAIGLGFVNLGKAIFTGLTSPISLAAGAVQDLFSNRDKSLDIGPQISNLDLAARNAIPAFTSLTKIIGVGLVAATGVATAALVKTSLAIDTMNESLILNGARLGVTREELVKISSATSGLTSSSNDIKGFFSELVKGGFYSKESLTTVANAAKELSAVTSLSLSDIAKQYIDLSKGPVEALIKLGLETGNVTVATIKHVEELKKQGKEQEAIRVAIDAMAEAHRRAAKDIENSLSPVSGILKGLKILWKELGDAATTAGNNISTIFLSVGKYANLALNKKKEIDLLDKLSQGKISKEDYDSEINKLKEANKFTEDSYNKLVNGNSKKLDASKEYNAEQIKLQQKYQEAMKGFQKQEDDLLAKRLTKQQFVAQQMAKLSSSMENQAILPQDFKAVKSKFEKEWEDANKKSGPTGSNSKAENEQKRLQESADYYKLLANSDGQAYNENYLKKKEELETLLKGKYGVKITQQEYDVGIKKLEEDQPYFKNAKKREEDAKKLQAITDDFNRSLEQQLSLQLLSIDAKNKDIGLTEEERLVKEQLAKIEENRVRNLERINDLVANSKLEGDALTQYRNKLKESESASYEETKRIVEARTRLAYEESHSFESGWKNAFASYLDSANNAATTAQTLFQKMTDGMTDAIVQFATTGKLSFSDFANSIIKEMLAISAKRAALGLTGLLGGLVIGTSPALASSGYDQVGKAGMAFSDASAMWNANGNAFNPSGIVHAFANGGTFTNSIVNSPTPFMFANGGSFGVMGEAGPEAVMPLQRTSNGKLGVISTGGNSSPVNVEVNVSIASDGSATTTSNSEVAGKNLGNLIAAAVTSAIIKEKRNGGLLSSNK